MLGPFHHVEPDPFHQLIDQDMAAPTHPHRPSYYHGTAQGTGGHFDWQPWQDSHMHAMVLPAHANRTFDADAISPSSASLLEVQNNLSTLETTFDGSFAEPGSDVNGYLDFFENSVSMLPPTGPFVPLDNHFCKWDSLFSSMSFPSTLGNLPATPNMYSGSLNHIVMSGDPGFDALDNNIVRNIGSSTPANDHLPLTHSSFFPSFYCIMKATKI
jgi:hypothetical protein